MGITAHHTVGIIGACQGQAAANVDHLAHGAAGVIEEVLGGGVFFIKLAYIEIDPLEGNII